jgi:sugar-specific transcriptional regulator TrmB
MKIKINGTEIELTGGSASFDVKNGTLSFSPDHKDQHKDQHKSDKLFLIEGPETKALPAPKRKTDTAITKTSIKNKLLKMFEESQDGIVTSQSITYTVLGKFASSDDKTFLKRVISDLVSEGVLVTEKKNERSIFKLANV